MSADAWRHCPKCLATARAAKTQQRLEADAAYGKIPADEWRKLAEAAEPELPEEETLREDYEIYMQESGKFFCSYRCSCSVCEFQWSFRVDNDTVSYPKV